MNVVRCQPLRRSGAALLALALGLAADSRGQGAPLITSDTAKRIDAVFASWDNTHSPGCALGVSRNGSPIYVRGYGMANLEYDAAITPDSIFHVASVSKQFTAFAIGLLARDGKLSLDDDMRRYLPELPDYGRAITLRQLVMHTGGLRDYSSLLIRAGWREEDVVTEADVLRILARQKSPNFQPGTEFLYSNTAYTLLAIIVGRVSGQSFREFAETRIFAPLGMRDTHVQDDHTMIVRRRTSGYEPRPSGGLRSRRANSDTSGHGNLFTTAGDLLTWQQNLADGRVGGKGLTDEMQLSGRLNDGTATDYGFGLLIEPYRGVRTVNHGGTGAGYRADAVRFPDHELSIVALCNLSTINPRVLTRRVAEIVLGPGVFEPISPTVSIARAEMARLAGTYWNAHTEDVRRIFVTDGKLMTDTGPDVLVPLAGGRFRLGEQTTELRFSVSKTEASFDVSGAPVLTPATFTRVAAPVYSDADLQAYAGEYRSDELDVRYTVVATPGLGLSLLRSKHGATTLEVVKLDVFTGRPVLGTVVFVRAASGEVLGFTLSAGRTRGLSFTRVEPAPSARN